MIWLSYEERAKSIGITTPQAAAPLGAYVLAVKDGTLLFTAGQGSVNDGIPVFKGKVGRDLTLEQGYEAAKLSTVNCLAAAKSFLGSLNRIERVVKVNGYVNSAPGFTDQAKVINGASDLRRKRASRQNFRGRERASVEYCSRSRTRPLLQALTLGSRI